ncbi:MAG: tRNA guanosine-2'-O-methyltransferase TRM11, partial [Amphiamblys sp. WSBS2006]
MFLQCCPEDIRFLLSRSVQIRQCFRTHRSAPQLDALVKSLAEEPPFGPGFAKEKSFCFSRSTPGAKQALGEFTEMLSRLGFLFPDSTVSLSRADLVFSVIFLEEVYFCQFVGESVRRKELEQFDLKKRRYIGMTTMDAELSLVMANIGRARKGTVFYDPFVGTGGVLCACGWKGSYTVGSDIDGRPIRGDIVVRKVRNEKRTSLLTNMADYSIERRYLGSVVADATRLPFRAGSLFDGIVTDPPYGVRAGSVQLVSSDPAREGCQKKAAYETEAL